MRVGWAAHEADSSLQAFPLCMIYDCTCTIPKSEKRNGGRREGDVWFLLLESVPCNALDVSHQPAQAEAC